MLPDPPIMFLLTTTSPQISASTSLATTSEYYFHTLPKLYYLLVHTV